ncbi:hypothetical protein JHK82_050445 [Glycine max]|nr:hypothetical protein JHK85_051086 [Glycine max]KAG5091667.1 hypothetical protein JHK82_050445 [Glycine max]
MKQSKELEARKADVGENFASFVPRNPEAGSIPLVHLNMAFMYKWQATLSTTTSA